VESQPETGKVLFGQAQLSLLYIPETDAIVAVNPVVVVRRHKPEGLFQDVVLHLVCYLFSVLKPIAGKGSHAETRQQEQQEAAPSEENVESRREDDAALVQRHQELDIRCVDLKPAAEDAEQCTSQNSDPDREDGNRRNEFVACTDSPRGWANAALSSPSKAPAAAQRSEV